MPLGKCGQQFARAGIPSATANEQQRTARPAENGGKRLNIRRRRGRTNNAIALEVNDSAVKVLGEPTLQQIARELVASVRANTSIDWTIKESVRAKLRVIVKRILRKHGYPPDKQEKATQTVIGQAELLLADVT